MTRRRPATMRWGRRWCAGVLVALAAAAPGHAGRSIIPIPEIVLDPNEGATFGLLPVVLFTNEQDEIRYLLAPDFSYNRTRGFFPRFRTPDSNRDFAIPLARPRIQNVSKHVASRHSR